MKTSERREEASARIAVVLHALTAKGAERRSIFEPHRRQLQATEVRQSFDAIMGRVVPTEGAWRSTTGLACGLPSGELSTKDSLND